jgi:hypothetical protein
VDLTRCHQGARLHPSLARDQELGGRRLPDELCVESTARAGYKTGFRVVALADCATTLSEEEQHSTFDRNLPMFAKILINTEFLSDLALWLRTPRESPKLGLQ